MAKESSSKTISLASFETSVPVIPIATPTSAFFIAGASFIPSPVTATTFPILFIVLTTRIFIVGVLLAITDILSILFLSSSSFIASISLASKIKLFSFNIFSSLAIALAVTILSPVSIFILIPALLH